MQMKGKQAFYIGLFLWFAMETKDDDNQLGITVDEARELLGIGRNLMLQLVKLKGFPAIRFKKKIIINKQLLPKWFAENCRSIWKLSLLKIREKYSLKG